MWEIHDWLQRDAVFWKQYVDMGGPKAAGDREDSDGVSITVEWQEQYANASATRCKLMARAMETDAQGKIYYASSDFCTLAAAAYSGFEAFTYDEWAKMWVELEMPLRGLIYFRDAVPLWHVTSGGSEEMAHVRVLSWYWHKDDEGTALYFMYGSVENTTWHAMVANDTDLKGMVELGKLTGACWSLLQQRSVVEAEEVEKKFFGKQAKKRAAKQGRPPKVTVINIRQTVRRVEAESYDRKGRTYRHRWIVDGHWRNQACGPQRSLRKRVYILPYPKGEPGAPLLVKPKVYKW
jgi:hypothetical protein